MNAMQRLQAWVDAARRVRDAYRTIAGINGRNRNLVKPLNPRSQYPLVDDKLACKHALSAAGVPVPATLAVLGRMADLSRLPEVLSCHPVAAIKPSRGLGGGGILLLFGERAPGQYWRQPESIARGAESARQWATIGEIRGHLQQILAGQFAMDRRDDVAFLEELLISMPEIDRLSPGHVSDVRILVHRGVPVLAMTRAPTRVSGGRANLHQGAIGYGIDLADGRAVAAIFRNRPIGRHPDTGLPLEAFVVPRWAELLDIARRCAAAIPLGYLGVDIVLDRRHGPLVLELNARPGLAIQVANMRGLFSLVRPELPSGVIAGGAA
ncbi:MAG: alpha-L-glutamate ligase-like protein [Candidatus Schekmanbacteria bacterium]|nr:alpha-L-glutamate ligase-like protein [Candidatus Schekmanbacteria bacterium]